MRYINLHLHLHSQAGVMLLSAGSGKWSTVQVVVQAGNNQRTTRVSCSHFHHPYHAGQQKC